MSSNLSGNLSTSPSTLNTSNDLVKKNNYINAEFESERIRFDMNLPNKTSAIIITCAEKLDKIIELGKADSNLLKLFFDKLIDVVKQADYYGDRAKILNHLIVRKVIIYIFNNKIVCEGNHGQWINVLNTSAKEGIKILDFFRHIKNCYFNEGETLQLFKIIKDKSNLSYGQIGRSEMINFLSDNDIFNYDNFNELMELAIKHECKKFLDKIIEKAKIKNKKISFSHASLLSIFRNDDLDVFKIALTYNVKMSEFILNQACSHGSTLIVKFLLDNKISPTADTMKAIIEFNYTPSHVYGKLTHLYEKDKNRTLVNMIRSYGYVITYDDILKLTKARIKIDDFESLGIKLDSKYLEICTEISFYPYNAKGLVANQGCLEKECGKSGNLTRIKNLIKDGIKPTQACLQNACKQKNNFQAISFLCTKGLKFDEQCLLNISKTIDNRTLTKAIEEFIEQNNSKFKKQEDLIKKLQEDKTTSVKSTKTVELEDSDDSDNSSGDHSDSKKEEVIKKVTKKANTIKKTKKEKKTINLNNDTSDEENKEDENKNNKIIDEIMDTNNSTNLENCSEDCSEDYPDDYVDFEQPKNESRNEPMNKKTQVTYTNSTFDQLDDDDKLVKKSKKVKSKSKSKDETDKKKSKKINITNDVNEINKINEINKVDTKNINNVTNIKNEIVLTDPPEDYDLRIERDINSKILSVFDLKPKTRLSYLGFRKHFYQYLLKKNMIEKENIKLDKQIANFINKKENDLINVKDIDKVVYTLLKNSE